MKSNDHVTLAKYLLESVKSAELKRHEKAFLFGSIEPDYNIFTYLRGLFFSKAFHGHDTENSGKHIKKCLRKLMYKGIHSAFDYFMLGTVIHYITDSFTFPHNAAFQGSLRDHLIYEEKLHYVFSKVLILCEKRHESGIILSSERLNNDELRPFMIDSNYIVNACQMIFIKLINFSYEPIDINV